MLKKLTSIFLFACLSSLQALQTSFQVPKFSDLNNLTQESYDQSITIFSQIPGITKFLPKKPITDEQAQIHFITLIGTIMGRSMLGTITVAFYDNITTVEPIKKIFEETKNGYIVAIDIHKIAQDIKDIFNITKPTLIYYHNSEETTRNTNFDSNNVVQHIKNSPFAPGIEISRYADLKNLIQETYDQSMSVFAQIPGMSKLISKKPTTKMSELTQVRFLTLLGAIGGRSMLGITAVVFYNNAQKIESLKKFVEGQKSVYFIVTDIHKTEQEIKNVFNITTEPTIIYYMDSQEVARSTNFDTKDVLNRITTISMLMSKLRPSGK